MKKLFTILFATVMMAMPLTSKGDESTIMTSNWGSSYTAPEAQEPLTLTLTSTGKKDSKTLPSDLADFITSQIGTGSKLYSTYLSSNGLITVRVEEGYVIDEVKVGLSANGTSTVDLGHGAFSADGETYFDYTSISALSNAVGNEVTFTPTQDASIFTFGRGTIGGRKPSKNTEARIYYIIVTYSSAKEIASEYMTVTGATIDGTAISTDDLETLNGASNSLTLTTEYTFAPTVVLNATKTTVFTDNTEKTKDYEVSATAVDGENDTYVATIDIDGYIYTVTVDKDLTPVLSVTPENVTLTSEHITYGTATINVTGVNLTGTSVTISLPDVEGLTCTPASLDVTDGKVSGTFTLSYQSVEDVEAATATATISDGETSSEVEITYSSTAAVIELVPINGDTTWDWATTSSMSIQLTNGAGRNEDVILANFTGWPSDFKADAIEANGEWINRGGYFQGYSLKFISNVPGKVEVTFANTGGSNGTRNIMLNGVEFGDTGNNSSKKVTATSDAIGAGTFVISSKQTAEGGSTAVGDPAYIRIYKVVFINEEPSGIESVAIDNTTSVYYNLQGVRVDNPVKGNVYIRVAGSKAEKVVVK